VERVLGLGEYNELAADSVAIDHQFVVENFIEIKPLCVFSRTQDSKRFLL